MHYRLINIASNVAWKQPATDRTHTLTFRESTPEIEDGTGMNMGNSFTRQYTAAEAEAFELGGLYEIGVTPAN